MFKFVCLFMLLKKVIVGVLATCCSVNLLAIGKVEQENLRHEIRVGYGDAFFERTAFHSNKFRTNYRYTGHFFSEYQFNLFYWLSFGGKADYEWVGWDLTAHGKKRTGLEQTKQYFYNINFLSTVRFTYGFRNFANMYSGIGVGANMNYCTQKNTYNEKNVVVTPAFEFTFLGIAVGSKHWFGAFEIGGLYALSHKSFTYMINSRMFSLSVGYRF